MAAKKIVKRSKAVFNIVVMVAQLQQRRTR